MSRNQVNNPDDLRKTVKNGKNKRKKANKKALTRLLLLIVVIVVIVMVAKNISKNKKIKLEEVDSLEEAVLIASKISKSGDIVVMSPASASFDMFKNYKERGKLFKNLVSSLKNK